MYINRFLKYLASQHGIVVTVRETYNNHRIGGEWTSRDRSIRLYFLSRHHEHSLLGTIVLLHELGHAMLDHKPHGNIHRRLMEEYEAWEWAFRAARMLDIPSHYIYQMAKLSKYAIGTYRDYSKGNRILNELCKYASQIPPPITLEVRERTCLTGITGSVKRRWKAE